MICRFLVKSYYIVFSRLRLVVTAEAVVVRVATWETKLSEPVYVDNDLLDDYRYAVNCLDLDLCIGCGTGREWHSSPQPSLGVMKWDRIRKNATRMIPHKIAREIPAMTDGFSRPDPADPVHSARAKMKTMPMSPNSRAS